MIIPDVNILLYSTDSRSAHHSKTRKWWQGILQDNIQVGFCAPVVFGYVRLATHPKLSTRPLSIEDAFSQLELWLQLPTAQWLIPDESHFSRVKDFLLDAGTGGNLVPDAQIAAFAQQYNATICSADADFRRLRVKWVNPLST